MKAIYTKVVRDEDGEKKGVVAKVRASTGAWLKGDLHYWSFAAPEDYNHSGAAQCLIFKLGLDNGYLQDLRMAEGATDDERIFI